MIMKKISFYFRILLITSLFCGFSDVYAQDKVGNLINKLQQTTDDIQKASLLNQIAQEEILLKDYDKAIAYSQQATEIANKFNGNDSKGKSFFLIGKAYELKRDFPSALNNYLQSTILYESTSDQKRLAENYYEIGLLYQNWKIYEKAIKYFKQANEIEQKIGNKEGIATSLKYIANAYFQINDFPNAVQNYNLLLDIYKKQGSKKEMADVLHRISIIHEANGKYDDAINSSLAKLEIDNELKDLVGAAHTNNNIGYIYKKKKDVNKSLQYFQQSLDLFKKAYNQSSNAKKNVVILTNIGVAYTNLNDYKNAQSYYDEALRVSEKDGKPEGIANVNNFIGANHYINGNNDRAMASIQKAIEIAEPNKLKNVLQESYRILSAIYERENDFKESQKYYKMHSDLKEEIEKEQKAEEARLAQNQLNAEQKEGEFKLLIADKEKQALTLKQLNLEADKKNQELALLKQDKDLQESKLKAEKLEKERFSQALALAQQSLQAEQKNKQIQAMQQAQQISAIKDKQKEAESNERQQKIKLLEQENEIRKTNEEMLKLKSEEDEATRKYFMIAIVAAGLFVLLILFVLFQRNKANKLLQTQQLEIKRKNEELQSNEEELRQNMEELQTTQEQMESKQGELQKANVQLEKINAKIVANEAVLQKALEKIKADQNIIKQKNEELQSSDEELRQNMEELQTTQEALEKQRNQLQAQNLKVTQSIRYAERIQSAILPTPSQRKSIFPESFLIYRPKDIVSGDFYWISKHGDKSLVSVIDCTGHGVPGAFMSMVGNSILNEIINERKIIQPALILNELHLGVRKKLSQNEGANNDGMDLGFCLIEPLESGEFRLTHAGAKNKFYAVVNHKLVELQGDRKVIGGATAEETRNYTNQQFVLNKGDSIYMSSDGFTDQCNAERRSFGSTNLKALIMKSHELSVNEQEQIFVSALENHQQDEEQRDDITLICVKL
ncbi:MAG: hypothetical protein EAZ97_04520 [Bacteroidetes bacterium]|nr:MAG: hypothetical protein EAZ97_04520 [Bacteroidota bacterium]